MDSRYTHRWLLLLPFVWQVGAVPFVNDVAWRPLSLPFPMVWQIVGIVFATLIIALVFVLDEKVEGGDDQSDGTNP